MKTTSDKALKKGYTTGAHAYFLFKKALEAYLITGHLSISKTNKTDNDDLDATKGCEITAMVGDDIKELKLNPIFQLPATHTALSNKISLYAGEGVGVATKKGLKIEPNSPAINPAPRDAIFGAFEKMCQGYKNLDVKCAIGVTNGEEIAKNTANAKVGVLGGISILGTTGIVKPVSSSAYLDSIKTEIEFAAKNGYKRLYFTLGASAFEAAKAHFGEEAIVEVGNYVFDSIGIALKSGIQEVLFLSGIGKMTKVAQGFKNTHNRFGEIDFELLREEIRQNIGYVVDIDSTLTVKGVAAELEERGFLESFYETIAKKAQVVMRGWYDGIVVKAIIFEQNKAFGW